MPFRAGFSHQGTSAVPASFAKEMLNRRPLKLLYCEACLSPAAARLAAEGLGLRVHGTTGVIVRSLRKARRTADQVVELLQAIPVRSSLHTRRHLLDETIRQVKGRGSP